MNKFALIEEKAQEGAIITLEAIRENARIRGYLNRGDEYLSVIGYTEHGHRHASLAARNARYIMTALGKDEHLAELAAIGAYLHDIGNVINRQNHAQTGAILAHTILNDMGMPIEDLTEIVLAIGNHHEEDGAPVSQVSAAVILADKVDVHRSRVRNLDMIKFDIHDRVNYAVKHSALVVSPERKQISFRLTIDTSISPVMEYFEIFVSRMVISRRAAAFLGCEFELIINETKLI